MVCLFGCCVGFVFVVCVCVCCFLVLCVCVCVCDCFFVVELLHVFGAFDVCLRVLWGCSAQRCIL